MLGRALLQGMRQDFIYPVTCCCCREPKKYKRQVTYNWKGIAAYAFFCVAFVFYMWIRITKTLNLGAYLG